MLSCRDLAHHYASDYLDDQLGWRPRLGVRFHLLICEHCRRFVAQLRKVQQLLREKPLHASFVREDDLIAQRELGERLAEIYTSQKNSSPPL